MSFRAFLVLLCVSTVVIAQVKLPSEPSPSLPETVVPEQLPGANNDKRTAPNPPTVAKQNRTGVRLAVSVPQPEEEPQRTVIESVAGTSQSENHANPKNSIRQFPRTASLTIDGTVPIPRPLPRNSADNTEVTPVDRLSKELRRKQRELAEIQSEIRQLTLDIAAVDRAQVLVNVELFETVGDQVATFVELMSTKGQAPNDPTDTSDNMVVKPESFQKMLRGLADSGQLIALTRPKLITVSGQPARIEVGNEDGGIAFEITPKFRNDDWLIVAECEDHRDGRRRTYGMSVLCDKGEAIGFRMKLDDRFLIGLIHPQVVSPSGTGSLSTSTKLQHSGTPLLPIPAWSAEPETEVREVQWLDLHLDRAPVLR